MFVWHMRTNIAKNNVTSTSTTFKKHLFYKICLYTGEIQCDKKQNYLHTKIPTIQGAGLS